MANIALTEREKEIVASMAHHLYTVEYLEEWINRKDSVFINAMAALNAMGAWGFYEAVRTIAHSEHSDKPRRAV